METKDELLIYKSALEKLLAMENYFYNGFRDDGGRNCMGLCFFIRLAQRNNFITKAERDEVEWALFVYKEEQELCEEDFFWEPGEWQPRKQWLEYELSIVNQELKQYDSFSTKVKANIERIRLFMKLINKR